MTAPQSITSELQKLAPSAVIELFELDATVLGAGIYRFHAGTNELTQNVVWQGNTYTRFPVQVTGFEITGRGQLPRPTLRVSNFLSAITALLLEYEDLVGAKLTRKRTLKKFLDAVNFAGGLNPTADSTASYPDDVYYIDRKANETREVVEFELASSIDLAGVQIPRRQIIQNVCTAIYRGPECGYTGTLYFTANDQPTVEASQDKCGKRLNSCKLRFGSTAELPFQGFPGAGLIRS